ncbi:MAG: tetratricopeptide repeat protein [Spirochaetes bacterium]|nr:tetratricopeptide repeat protein [Spirochaetota bacterium]
MKIIKLKKHPYFYFVLNLFLSIFIFTLLILMVKTNFIFAQEELPFNEDNNFYDISEAELVAKASEYVDKGNISEGLKLLLEGFKKFRKSRVIPKKLGEIFYSQELYPLALKYFKIANKRGDKSHYLLSMIADTYAYMNEDKKAIEWFEKSFAQYLYQPYNFYSYIWILLKLELFDLAKQKIDQHYNYFSGFSYLDSALAVLYANLGEYEKSKYYYKKVLNFPGSYQGTIYYNWGILEYTFYNYNEAYSLFMKTYTNSDMPEAFLALGEIYYANLNFDLANSLFIGGLEKLQAPLILYNLFELNRLRGFHEKALEYGKKIINYNNESWIYKYNLNKNEHLANHYEFLYEYATFKIKYEKKFFTFNFLSKLKNTLNIIFSHIQKKYFDIMKKYYNIKVLKKYNFDYAFIEYYKRLIKIYDWNKYFYLKFLEKLDQYYKKYYGNKTGTIPYLYLEYAKKFNDFKIFKKYEKIFLENYDKNYERNLYLNYLLFKVDISYKNKDYVNYFNSILEILKINPDSIKNINVPIVGKVQFFNLSKKEIKIFKSYLRKKNFLIFEKLNYSKYMKNIDINIIFIINIEKIDDNNYLIYLINPFESYKLKINYKNISKDNIDIIKIFNPYYE